MIKSILLLLFLPLLLIPVYGQNQEIFITTDKTEYYKDEPIIINGTMTEIDWSEDTSISYNVKDVKNIFPLGIGENITTLNNDGTFSFTIDFTEREPWTIFSSNVSFFVTSQNATANIMFFISDQINISNESLYERSMIHEERISSHNSTILTLTDTTNSHDMMLNDHNTMMYGNNDMINELVQRLESSLLEINTLRQEMQGIKDQIGGSPQPQTLIPVIKNFVGIGNGDSITLSWDITGEPIIQYNLIYRYEQGSWDSDDTIPSNTTSHTIINLQNQEYEIKLSAENEHGESKITKLSITP